MASVTAAAKNRQRCHERPRRQYILKTDNFQGESLQTRAPHSIERFSADTLGNIDYIKTSASAVSNAGGSTPRNFIPAKTR